MVLDKVDWCYNQMVLIAKLHCSISRSICQVFTQYYCLHTLTIHRLLNCEIDGLECHVITTEYRTHVNVNVLIQYELVERA